MNDLVRNVSTLRTDCTPLEPQSEVVAGVAAAMSVVKEHVSRLDLSFKIPFLQPLAVIWPGTESAAAKTRVNSGPSDDLLE